MNSPSFLRNASRRLSRRYELVHVESGAVLGSRVEISTEARPWKRRSALARVRSGEPALFVAGARWAHTCRSPGPADIVFVDADGTVVKTLREVKPWRVVTARGARAFIQGPPGLIDRTDTSPGDRLALREAQAVRPLRDVAPARSGIDLVPESIRAAVDRSLPEGLREGDDGLDPWHMGAEEVAAAAPVSPPRVEAGPPRAEPAAARSAPGQAPAATVPSRAPARAGPRPSPAGPSPGKTPARPAFSTGVDLERIIARETPLAWFEAVAIAQELYVVLLARGPAGTACNLDTGDVAITPDGGVELRRGHPPGLPTVREAAHILLTLLGEAQTLPVELRLLALQEVSPSPTCATLLELSTRLALFERPGRQAAIRDVYERFSRLPPREAESRPATPPPAALTAGGHNPWWRKRSVQALAGALSVILVSGLAAVWWWSAAAPPPPGQEDHRGPIEKAAAAAGESVSAAAAGTARTVSRWFGLEADNRPAPVPPVDTIEAALPSGSGLPRRPAARTAKPAAPDPGSGGAPPLPEEALDPTVYSGADAAVVPPSPVRVRQPSNPPDGVRAEDLPELELVISATGEVESVRLLTRDAGVGPAMMLSAVKAWRFRPATRNGEPVRYRLRMRLTHQ